MSRAAAASMPSATRFLARTGARRSFPFAIAGAALVAFAASGADAKTPLERELPALFAALEKADAVVEGSASPKRILYIFFDANCWYCHLTWKALQPYEKAGLQVRWVPVAYQKDSSTTKAAAIMQAKDRVGRCARTSSATSPAPTTAGSRRRSRRKRSKRSSRRISS